jgi:hypothetical protein
MIHLLLPLFTHITFKGIPPTVYENHGEVIAAHVESSSSFLFQPFSAPRAVKRVSFRWRYRKGEVGVKDAATEATKPGDDAAIRVGLLLSGAAPTIPAFAPAWVKAVRDKSKLPADDMIFVVGGSKHKAGTVWPSPYDDDLHLVAADESEQGGWRFDSHEFSPAADVVGIWIMADGDDTKSSFDIEFKELRLE